MSQHDRSNRPLYVSGVCERDIDLLLLEEFLSTPEFGQWFAGSAGLSPEELGDVLHAYRSVTHSTGESDLEVHYEGPRGCTTLLIENKVDAILQPAQAERYHLRGADYLASGRCARFFTVIVAPDEYFRDATQTKGFQYRVSYEAVMQWFDQAERLGARRRYKVDLLRSGIEKIRSGYQHQVDAAVTEFFQCYTNIVSASYPGLGMLPTGERASRGGRVHFKRPELTAVKVDIAHKSLVGWVDLRLRERAERMPTVIIRLSPLLEPGMSIRAAGKSPVVGIQTPVLDPSQPAQPQLNQIQHALSAVKRLQCWALEHHAVLAELI